MKIIFNYLKHPRTASLFCILSAFTRDKTEAKRGSGSEAKFKEKTKIGINFNETLFCVLQSLFAFFFSLLSQRLLPKRKKKPKRVNDNDICLLMCVKVSFFQNICFCYFIVVDYCCFVVIINRCDRVKTMSHVTGDERREWKKHRCRSPVNIDDEMTTTFKRQWVRLSEDWENTLCHLIQSYYQKCLRKLSYENLWEQFPQNIEAATA